jgi:hypothetical protein
MRGQMTFVNKKEAPVSRMTHGRANYFFTVVDVAPTSASL